MRSQPRIHSRANSLVDARSEKRMPRHDVRLRRYRRAPTIAIGMKTAARI